MKRLLSKRAFTLLETLLAIAIIAAIALPLMSVFLQSVKTNQASKGVLSANYISQDYIEKLDTATYEEALSNQPDRVPVDGYYLSASIEPYGTASAMFTGACVYAHLVFYADGRMLAVMPDGNWRMFSAIPASISISAGGGMYSFSAGSATLTGSMDSANCAVIIDAMEKPSGSACTVTLGAAFKALRYCKEYDVDDITVTGTGETYCDLVPGDTSLIHVKTYVYGTAAAANPVATGESYINIKNW